MNTLITILLVVFAIFGFVLAGFAYVPIIKICFKKNKIKKQGLEKNIEENLRVLKEKTDGEQLAKAFIELMENSYVLVHVIVNKGNTYKDNIQCRRFLESLSPEIVDKIKSLEADNGTCTF